LDHNCVLHRSDCFRLVPRWDDDPAFWPWADAIFFRNLAQYWEFHPLDAITDEKRYHPNSVQAKAVRGDSPYLGTTE
jgi:hypothetical protein